MAAGVRGAARVQLGCGTNLIPGWVKLDMDGPFPGSPRDLVNEGTRLWGQRYLLEEQQLTTAFVGCGFRDVVRQSWRYGDHPELAGRETRSDHGDLIVEATR